MEISDIFNRRLDRSSLWGLLWNRQLNMLKVSPAPALDGGPSFVGRKNKLGSPPTRGKDNSSTCFIAGSIITLSYRRTTTGVAPGPYPSFSKPRRYRENWARPLPWRSTGAEPALRIPRLTPGLNPGRQILRLIEVSYACDLIVQSLPPCTHAARRAS